MKKLILALAAGFLLSGVGLTSAQGAPLLEHLSVAPHGAAAKDCSPYPASVFTQTNLRLANRVVRHGNGNDAHVRVVAENGTPQGSVTLDVSGPGTSFSETATLHGGSASFRIPSALSAGTYTVVATYDPGCSRYVASGDSAAFTVTQRAHHHTHHHHHHHHHHHDKPHHKPHHH